MIDPFVLDASMAFTWLRPHPDIPRERIDLREGLAHRTAVVSHLWRFEMLNVLAMSQRIGSMSAADAAVLALEASRIGAFIADEGDPATVLALASVHGLTAYDASYLAICLRHGWPLASLDARLLRAAGNAGVEVL